MPCCASSPTRPRSPPCWWTCLRPGSPPAWSSSCSSPRASSSKDFYAELPIKIKVNGHYHEFGRFVSGLAALPRIVTLHDVKIDAPPAQKAPARGAEPQGHRLSLQATVKTYRYLDEAAFK